jgi:hypothetical protein
MSKIITMKVKALCVFGCVLSGMNVMRASEVSQGSNFYPRVGALSQISVSPWPNLVNARPTAPSALFEELSTDPKGSDLQAGITASQEKQQQKTTTTTSSYSSENLKVITSNKPAQGASHIDEKVSSADRYVCVPLRSMPFWTLFFRPNGVTARRAPANNQQNQATTSAPVSQVTLNFSQRTRCAYSYGHWACNKIKNLCDMYGVGKYIQQYETPVFCSFVLSGAAFFAAPFVPWVGSSIVSPLLKPFFAAGFAVEVAVNAPRIMEKLSKAIDTLPAAYTVPFKDPIICQRVTEKQPTLWQRIFKVQRAELK